MFHRQPANDQLQPGTRVVQARASVSDDDAATQGSTGTLRGYTAVHGYAHLVDVTLPGGRPGPDLLLHPEDLDPAPPTKVTPCP